MTFIIDTGRSETRLPQTHGAWKGSLVAPQQRSFRPETQTRSFTPAGERYRALSEEERDALIAELAVALSTCSSEVQSRMISGFAAVDPDYGRRVAEALTARCRN